MGAVGRDGGSAAPAGEVSLPTGAGVGALAVLRVAPWAEWDSELRWRAGQCLRCGIVYGLGIDQVGDVCELCELELKW